MRLSEIKIQNFRCFEDLTVKLSPQMNILIGNNASGKTTILKAVRILLGKYIDLVNQANPQIQLKYPEFDLLKDIRIRKTEKNWERSFPLLLEAIGNVFGEEISWLSNKIHANINATFLGQEGFLKNEEIPYDFALEIFVKENISSAIKDNQKILPLVAYYPTDRLWEAERIDKKDITSKNDTRFLGYESALRVEKEFAPINLHKITNRFRTILMNEIQHQYVNKEYRDAELELYRNVIKNAIPHCEYLIFDLAIGEFILYFEGGDSMPFSLLSDGFRNILALMLDMTFRVFTLNPDLGTEAAAKTEGMVLIDEIDLHLHPSWQKRIINDLRKIFPNIQFIVTTHSPLIIASANENEVLSLDRIEENVLKADKLSYQAWQFENILKDVMSDYTTNQSNVTPILMQLNEALKSKNIEKFDFAFNELSKILHPNDSLLTFYKFKKIDLV